ncbi:MAG: MMPL family transporter, partial [Candidatus Limnocylindrales bacterium]
MTPAEPSASPLSASAARPAPWTARVAGWSARHRWPVFGLWFVVTIGIFVASLAAGGTNAVEAVSNAERSKYEAGEAYVIYNDANANSGQGQAPPSQQFLLVVSSPDRTVDDPAYAADIAAITTRLGAIQSMVDGVAGPVITQLVNPITVPPAAGLVSPDRTSVRIVGRVLGEGDALTSRLEPVPAEIDAIKAAYPAYRIHALNNVLANDEIQKLINGGLDDSLKLTIPLTFLILLIAFGAVIAAVIPLILAITALLAAFGILGLYSQAISPVSPYASQLVVLIGLAVAVDYSLFMVTRFRTERRHGRPKLAAIDVASNTAGRAVFFSGLAVMISIGGLFLLDDPLFRSMAVGTIAVVFVAVVGSLTFLPATLAILGDGVNRLRLPFIGRDRREGSGIWAMLVRAVMGRPILAAVATSALLLVVAAPVVRLHMGQADFTSFPDSLDGVQAVNLLNEKWPSGSDLDLSVVVTRADEAATKAAIETMSAAVLQISGLSGPPRTDVSADGHVAFINYLMAGGSNDLRNQDIVRQVRTSV